MIRMFSLVALGLSVSAISRAEIVQAILQLSPLNEVPPITNLNASGGMQVTITITRNNAGTITAAQMSFLGSVTFPGSVTIQGLHIHEGDSRTNGNVRFESGLSGTNALVFGSGAGLIARDVAGVDLTILQRLLAHPAGFYVNLHTTAHPSGALRAQFTRFNEILAQTIELSPGNEVPPISGLNARGLGTVMLYPRRNAQGEITGGSVNFTVEYDFPAATVIRGLHVHEGSPTENGPVRIDSGLSAANTLNATSGKGTYSHTVWLTDSAALEAMKRMLANPAGFYLNLHTVANPGGALRGQLSGTFDLAPVIALSNTHALTTGTTAATVNLQATNIDLLSTPLLNGQPAQYSFDFATGQVSIQVPADLRANPGVIAVQMRALSGTTSLPLFIPVATSEGSIAAVTDAAGYNSTVAPEGIAALFGTNLATITAGSPAILPNAIDGTTVYVNGTPAPLFFVSPAQINFQIPENTIPGPATVIVRNNAGALARATINVAALSPGIFTRLANGRGAPAAVASTDNGQTYALVMSNADGTPVELQTGHIAVLFGTGMRFRSMPEVTASAAGVTLTPAYVGAQGTLIGLDQINLVIPPAMAGKGETDLVFTIDGKNTNPIRIKVR
jgi:uncharacterized protein (TIGR03437 family)